MCTKKPKVQAPPPAPAPQEPVAPLVSAAEGGDPNELLRKKGRDALKVSAPTSAVSGLNIP